MLAGSLRHRVTIEEPVTSRTQAGGIVDSYHSVATVWAQIEPLTSREFWSAQQIQSDISIKVTIRYRPWVTAKHRLRVDLNRGSPTLVRYYDIEGDPIEIQGKRREIQLMCKLRDAEGFRTGNPS